MRHNILHRLPRSNPMALLQFCFVPLLWMSGLLAVVVLCSWDNPGIHGAQARRVVSLLDLLVLQSPFSIFFCRLSSSFLISPASGITLPLPVSPGLQRLAACPALFALSSMPILRQRMGCRRGGARGRPICQASSSSSDTFSGSSRGGTESHPATRRGRGRGRGNQAAMSNPHHTHAHSARFQIPWTLSNHSFIASVTIQLSEGAVGLVPEIPNATSMPRAEEFLGTSQNPRQQGDVPRSSASQDKQALACSNVPSEVGPPKEEGHPSDDDDSSSFGCRIVEKVPSTAQDA